MANLSPVPPPLPVDQTSARDAGHTTSEHFWTKVLVICGIVISVASFAADALNAVAQVLPSGSSVFKIAGIVGALVALLSKIAYEVSRTLVKLKLVDAEIAASNAAASGKAPKSPEAAAASVLGEDAPQ